MHCGPRQSSRARPCRCCTARCWCDRPQSLPDVVIALAWPSFWQDIRPAGIGREGDRAALRRGSPAAQRVVICSVANDTRQIAPLQPQHAVPTRRRNRHECLWPSQPHRTQSDVNRREVQRWKTHRPTHCQERTDCRPLLQQSVPTSGFPVPREPPHAPTHQLTAGRV